MSAPGQAAHKFCVVTIAPKPSSKPSTHIDYSDNYYYLRFEDLKQNEIMYSEISVSDPNLSLCIVSNDESIIQVSPLQKEDNSPGHYAVVLSAVGQGYTTLTITASDGTVDNMAVTVKGFINKDYTLTSDTTQDFTIPQNGSYFLKLVYTYTGPTDDPTSHGAIGDNYLPLESPLLVSDNPAVQITPIAVSDGEFFIPD